MKIAWHHALEFLNTRRAGTLMPFHDRRRNRIAVSRIRVSANGFRPGKRLEAELAYEPRERAKIFKRFAAVPDFPVMHIAAVRAAGNIIGLWRKLCRLTA